MDEVSKTYNNSLTTAVCTKELKYVKCLSFSSSVRTCNVGKRSANTEPAVTEISMELDFEAQGIFINYEKLEFISFTASTVASSCFVYILSVPVCQRFISDIDIAEYKSHFFLK